MAGALEVLVVKTDRPNAARKLLPDASVVLLSKGFYLVPLTEQVKAAIGGGDEPCFGFETLTRPVVDKATELSHLGPVAYFHLEFHGGGGFHAAIVWSDGAVRCGPLLTANHPSARITEDYVLVAGHAARGDMAINAALRFMGVEARDHIDEFEAVDLVRHRWTDDWVPT